MKLKIKYYFSHEIILLDTIIIIFYAQLISPSCHYVELSEELLRVQEVTRVTSLIYLWEGHGCVVGVIGGCGFLFCEKVDNYEVHL